MRKHRMAFLVAAVTALGFVGVPDAVAAPRVVLLENLPGALTSSASDINTSGVVVGESGGRAVRWARAGVPTALGNPADVQYARAVEITDSGFILGTGPNNRGGSRALLWDAQGQIIELQYFAGGNVTHAADVNNAGAAVGYATDADGRSHSVRWDRQGRVFELPTLPNGSSSSAFAINDAGTIAGDAQMVIDSAIVTHAVKWDSADRIIDLAPKDGLAYSTATAINNAGTVVGSAKWDNQGRRTELAYPPEFTYVWATQVSDGGAVIGAGYTIYSGHQFRRYAASWDLKGNPVGLGMNTALAVNRTGTVVGRSGYDWQEPTLALKWDRSGNATILRTPVGPWNVAAGINDAGVICGSSSNSDGTGTRAVIWLDSSRR